MGPEGYLVDNIFVYYKILNAGFLKSSSESECLHSCSDNLNFSYIGLDSSDSEFMCTTVDSKDTLYVADILHLLDGLLDSSKYVMFTKVLVPLDSFYPYKINLDHLDYPSMSHIQYRSTSDTSSKYYEKTNDLNRNINIQNANTMGFKISNLSKNFKIDSLRTKLGSSTRVEQQKRPHLVWVSVNLDDPIYMFENRVYIKLYLSTKSKTHGYVDDTDNITSDLLCSSPKNDNWPCTENTGYSTYVESKIKDERSFWETKIKTTLDEPVSASGLFTHLIFLDRDEINERITNWSHTGDGKLKDIRSLLSTLQNVLIDGISWDPMPFSLLVGDKDSIKKYYKKALLTFHPDKLRFKSEKNRLFSELLIQTLIKSWNTSM